MNLTRTFTFSVLLSTLFLFSAHAQDVRGNGNVIRKDREVSPFTSIVASDGWDLVLTQGNTYSMAIEADENLVDLVKTEVSNGVLKIYSDTRITQARKRQVHLSFRELNSIQASGGCDVYAETTVSAENFVLDLSGGSDLERFPLAAKGLTAKFSGGSDAVLSFESIQNIELDAAGGSDVQLKNISASSSRITLADGSDAVLEGRTDELSLTAAGGSDVEADGLDAKNADLNLAGASDCDITVTGLLNLTLSGGSDLSCRGNPQIGKHDACKSCDVRIR